MTCTELLREDDTNLTKESTMSTESQGRWVVVCTEKRGVFFGYTTDGDGLADMILTDARMCVYWDSLTRGVVGLAATGPTARCRITNSAPRLDVRSVTAVFDCTPEAVAAWQSAPWS